MPYPKLKVGKAIIDLNPSLIKLIREQVPGQLKGMTFTEMMELWNAIKQLLTVPALANIVNWLKLSGGNSGGAK